MNIAIARAYGMPDAVRGPRNRATDHAPTEHKARLMGLEAPTRRAVDVTPHDAFMEALADLARGIWCTWNVRARLP
jgi:hypothetical protein